MTDLTTGSTRPSSRRSGAQRSALRPDATAGARLAIAALRRRKYLFGAVFLSIVVLVAAFALTRPKLYTATASMVVNTREVNIAGKDQNVVPDTSTSEDAADTEIEIMRSPAVADGVVKALDLLHNPVFAQKLAKAPDVAKPTIAAAMVDGNLKIERPSQSNVVAISDTAPEPALAKQIADQIGQQYLQVKENSRRAAVAQVNRGMEQELGSLRDRLEQAEAAVADYKGKNGLLDTQGVTFTEQELSLYKQNEAAQRANLADAAAQLSAAHGAAGKTGGSGSVAAVLQSPVVQNLRNQRALLSAQIADLSSRYRDNHPDLVKLRDQRDAVDRAIGAEEQRSIANLSANVQVAHDREANARSVVDETAATIAHNDETTVKLNELQRRADALKLTYQTLLERRSAISSQALIADEDARVFSPAVQPLFASYPRKSLIGAIGLVLAAILAAATVWIVELFDRTLVTSASVETDLGLAHIANVPEAATIARPDEAAISPIDLPVAKPLSYYAEQLRAIRLALIHRARIDAKTVTAGITSSRPGEGKTTLSIGLARASALAGSRVLLIDADVRRPAIARALQMNPRVGLVEVLRGEASVDEAIVADPHSPAMILPTRLPVETGQELFDVARISRLLADLGDRFDLILFDAAPTLPVADARLLLRQLDSVLMLVRWNDTPRQVAMAALRRMRALDIEPVGAVMTRVDMRRLAAFGEGDDDRAFESYNHYYR